MRWFVGIFIAASFVFLSVFFTDCLYAYLFPIKFEKEVESAAAECDIDKSLIFSIINVESGFDVDAKSSKGAVGLMQVMPSTAEEVSGKIGLERFDLTDPNDNIKIGTHYFLWLKKNRLFRRRCHVILSI